MSRNRSVLELDVTIQPRLSCYESDFRTLRFWLLCPGKYAILITEFCKTRKNEWTVKRRRAL